MKAIFTLFPLFAAIPALADVAWSRSVTSEGEQKQLKFRSIPGFFKQDDEKTKAHKFDWTKNFGLKKKDLPIDDTFDSGFGRTEWERFERYVYQLNEDCKIRLSDTCRFKLLFLGANARALHQFEQDQHGVGSWNCYYAQLPNNNTQHLEGEGGGWEGKAADFPDPDLTMHGGRQALAAAQFIQLKHMEDDMPEIGSYYVSPLKRAMRTANLTFGTYHLSVDNPFTPIVKENLRADITSFNCDRRSNKTHLTDKFPTYRFEDGFTEEDELWKANHTETAESEYQRAFDMLEDVFVNDEKEWISFTTHPSFIKRILEVTKHRVFPVRPANILVTLVKAEVLEKVQTAKWKGVDVTYTIEDASPTQVHWARYRTHSTCDYGPPITSVDYGCHCPASTRASTTELYPTGIIGPMGKKFQQEGARGWYTEQINGNDRKNTRGKGNHLK